MFEQIFQFGATEAIFFKWCFWTYEQTMHLESKENGISANLGLGGGLATNTKWPKGSVCHFFLVYRTLPHYPPLFTETTIPTPTHTTHINHTTHTKFQGNQLCSFGFLPAVAEERGCLILGFVRNMKVYLIGGLTPLTLGGGVPWYEKGSAVMCSGRMTYDWPLVSQSPCFIGFWMWS